jgi:hypothetical protein
VGRHRRILGPLFALATVIAQGLTLWRGGALRWRLETYGIYMPSLPHARSWWRVNRRALLLLARRTPSYSRWLDEMAVLRTAGSSGWWESLLGAQHQGWIARLDCLGGGEDGV